MKYELGLMDEYPIEASGTNLENEPMLKVVLKERVDKDKLEDAVYRAFRFHPLFGTQVRFDNGYYLETNNRPIKLIKANEKNRPLEMGNSTNGYPWQICYDDKTIIFEWCHGVSDGMAALAFLRTVLSAYSGMEFNKVPRKLDLGKGLEPFYDKNQKGINFEVQPQGFNVKNLPIYHRGYKTDCHLIKGKTSDVLTISKKNESSPAALLSLLLSKAIRMHLPKNCQNKNVACNVVLNLRKPLNYETQHNCVEYKRVTLQDKHINMTTHDAAKEYKDILDQARIYENAVRMCTERVSMFNALHLVKGKKARKLVIGTIGKFIKDTDCNSVLTYLGNSNFPEEVVQNVSDVQFRVWHDFGECTIAAIDYNGTFNISLCENYIEKGVAQDFIKLCAEEGLHFEIVDEFEYEQIKFVEEGTKVKNSKPDTIKDTKKSKVLKPLPQAFINTNIKL